MITSFFIYLLQVSICSILFYGFYYLFLRKENFFQWNRIYLLGTAILSLTIPYFQINLDQAINEPGIIYLGLDDYLVEGVTNAFASTNSYWWTAENILLAIYSLGVLFFLTKILLSIFYVLKLKSNSSIQKEQGYYLIQTNTSHPVFSFFNMIFWNKNLEYSEKEAEQILLHERVHVNQKHSIDILFLEIIHALIWFNPFLYFYKKSLRDTHEFIADYQLFEKHSFQIQYVDLLMKEAKLQRENSLPVVHTFFNNQLKKRLVMIKNSKKHSSKIKLLGCLPILAILLFTFSIQTNAIAQTSGEDAIKAPKKGQIYIASDTDNEMTIKGDGTRRNDEEIKDYIIAQNKAEGQEVAREDIFLITKEVMMKNLREPTDLNLPEFEGKYRTVLVAGGKILIMEDKGNKDFQGSLQIKSFDAMVNKPTGKVNGKMEFTTLTRNHREAQLNKATMEFIQGIDRKYIDEANIVLRNIVVEKGGKEYLLKKESKLGVDHL